MKHHPCGHSSVGKEDVQTLTRQELDSNVLKLAQLQWLVLQVPKLVLTNCVWVDPKRPYATGGHVAKELRRYHVTVDSDGPCPFGRRRKRNFADSHFPIGGRTQIYRLG